MNDSWKALLGEKDILKNGQSSVSAGGQRAAKNEMIGGDGGRIHRQSVITDRYGMPLDTKQEKAAREAFYGKKRQNSQTDKVISGSSFYGVSRYGDSDTATPTTLFSGDDAGRPIPVRHFVAGVLILVLVVGAFMFRDDVRGVAAWLASTVRGEKTSLASEAPGVAKLFRSGRPYTMEEFLALCEMGNVENVIKILDTRPEFLTEQNGFALVRESMSRSIPPEVLGAVVKRLDRNIFMARDDQSRTLLHSAASTNVPPGYLLAMRHFGSEIISRDNKGMTPLDLFFASSFAKPSSMTNDERSLFSRYGYRMRNPYDRNQKEIFRPLTDQVQDPESKRFFSQLAHAGAIARSMGAGNGLFASGDMIGRPPVLQGNTSALSSRSRDRKLSEPLWKKLVVREDTGTVLARLKCLLPEAYPATLNFFSKQMTGTIVEPDFVTEWNGWDIPDQLRMAVSMQMLQQRIAKAKTPGQQDANPGNEYVARAMQSYRQRGDDPSKRDPLLMTWVLLEYGPTLDSATPGELLAVFPRDENGAERPKTTGGKIAQDELANLRRLHALLPKDVWRRVGIHLVAAAYTADKRHDILWHAAYMPDKFKEKGGLAYVRLWQCKDKTDPSEPMRRVLAETAKVSPELAEAMVTLVLRSGSESISKDKQGRTPLEYATEVGASAVALALLQNLPASSLSGKDQSGKANSDTKQVRPQQTPKNHQQPRQERMNPPKNGKPLGRFKNSTI